jgi:hypothetical protein
MPALEVWQSNSERISIDEIPAAQIVSEMRQAADEICSSENPE